MGDEDADGAAALGAKLLHSRPGFGLRGLVGEKAYAAATVDVPDMVNHPPHYTSHPSGVECIQVTEHLNFCLGNAIKYIWRSSEKGDQLENLKKARWYVDREIARLEKLKV